MSLFMNKRQLKLKYWMNVIYQQMLQLKNILLDFGSLADFGHLLTERSNTNKL